MIKKPGASKPATPPQTVKNNGRLKTKKKKGNKRKVAVGLVTAVILLAGIAGTLAYFQLSYNSKLKTVAEETVFEFLTAYRNKDPKAGTYLTVTAFGDSNLKFEGFGILLAEKLSFDITGSKIKNEQAIVTVEISNIDFGVIMEKYEDDGADDVDALIKQIESEMKNINAPTKKYSCNVVVNVYPGGMRIDITPDLSNALFGGVNEYLSSLYQLN